jgi:hypothetical protein
MTKPAITVEAIARREDCSVRKVNMTISLAFLTPDLVKAAIEGRLPYGMGVTRLCELPPEWSRQYRVLRSDRAVVATFEPVSRQPVSVFPGNGIQRTRDRIAKTACQLAAFLLPVRKSPQTRDCVVAHAVTFEPVSVRTIPC